jgi:hypothetical protein
MDKILINFDERNFNIRKRSIDAMSIKLNDLMNEFYKLNIITKDGVNLNELLYNENYINELISQRDDVAKLGFKNISELHKLFLDQDIYNQFTEVKNKVLTDFKKAHIPLNYFMLSNGLISVNKTELEALAEGYKTYAESDKEKFAYEELNKLTECLNEIMENINEISKRSIINPRGMNMNLIDFKDGKVKPSIEGVRTLSKQLVNHLT